MLKSGLRSLPRALPGARSCGVLLQAELALTPIPCRMPFPGVPPRSTAPALTAQPVPWVTTHPDSPPAQRGPGQETPVRLWSPCWGTALLDVPRDNTVAPPAQPKEALVVLGAAHTQRAVRSVRIPEGNCANSGGDGTEQCCRHLGSSGFAATSQHNVWAGAQGRSRLGTHPAGVAEGSRLHPLLAEHHGAVPRQHSASHSPTRLGRTSTSQHHPGASGAPCEPPDIP